MMMMRWLLLTLVGGSTVAEECEDLSGCVRCFVREGVQL